MLTLYSVVCCNKPLLFDDKTFSWDHVDVSSATVQYQIGFIVDVNFIDYFDIQRVMQRTGFDYEMYNERLFETFECFNGQSTE